MNILKENKIKGVMTTRDIVNLKKDVTYVSYDEDGDWQFYDDDDLDEKKILIISLEQIINIDKTLKELPGIKKNETFYRVNKNSKWEKIEN